MKKIIVLISMLVVVLSAVASEPLTFSAVEQVEGESQEELFNRAQAWYATTFKCGKCVIQTTDKETGQIIGRGAFEYTSATFGSSKTMKGWITYTVKVFVKDGRYKYEITDFLHEGTKTFGQYGVIEPISFGLITADENSPDIKSIWYQSPTKGVREKNWIKMKVDSEAESKPLIESLKKAMTIPASGDIDW